MIRGEKRYGGRSDARAAAAQEEMQGKRLPACKKKSCGSFENCRSRISAYTKSQPPCNSQSVLKASFKQVS